MLVLLSIVIFLVLFFIACVLLLIWQLRKLRDRFFGKHNPDTKGSKRRREGEVTIVHTEQQEQKVSNDVGEYVDFKEIKNR